MTPQVPEAPRFTSPWWSGITCDIAHHDAPVAPTYRWEGLWLASPDLRPILLCREAVLDMQNAGIPAEEFVPGETIGPGHWRPIRP
jgi:hypothetical protein